MLNPAQSVVAFKFIKIHFQRGREDYANILSCAKEMDRDKIPRAYDLAARREREFRKERAEREARGRPREVEDGFQPSMLTFKAFLQTQDDSITDGEALEKYGEYKLEFQRQQLNEFFVSHKSEEWFRIKYQPDARAARQVELQARLSARLAAFTELLREGGDFCEMTVEEDQAELLDRTVGMLENSEQPMEGDSDGHRTTSVFIASVHPRYVQNNVQIQNMKGPVLHTELLTELKIQIL